VAVCSVVWGPSQGHGTANGSSPPQARDRFAGVNKTTITP
jgi:hypothetical protein